MRPAIADPRQAAVSPAARVLVALVFVLGLGGAWRIRVQIEQHQQARFDYEIRRLEHAIRERMSAYVQVLRGGLGLFAASDEVTREDWRRYVDTLQLDRLYPGFRSLTFAPAVPESELEAFIARVRREPVPSGMSDPALLLQYRLRAPPPPITPVHSELHAPVLYTEPLTPMSSRALGVDMMLDQGRKTVMEAAAASDDAVLSQRLRLLMLQAGDSQVGFIAYLAVRRDEQLLGWLTATFLAENFMRGLMGSERFPLNFELYDGEGINAEQMLYSTAGIDANGSPLPLPQGEQQRFERQTVIDLRSRQWTLYAAAKPDFLRLNDQLLPWLVMLGGALASLLLYVTARASAAWRQQASVLEQAQAAVESANRAKTDFLANMSHEIRTPLNAILGTAELLGDTRLEADQRQSLDTITQSGDHLLGIVNDILDLTQVEAGLMTLDEQIFDLRRLVTESLALMAAKARQKGLKLLSLLEVDTPEVIRADPGRVRQVLLNYLSNAIKFTDAGEVRVEVSATPLTAGKYRLRIAVQDTGPGIPADQIDRLFKTFSQLDGASTRRHGGSGLGLAIARRLAELMGGEAGVETGGGQGSRFFFSFIAASDPAWTAPEKPVRARAPAATPAPLRVLLVEDNVFNQQVAMRMLESLGYRADLASNGELALAAVQQQAYDLLLMDMHMPVMDGLEATRRIRALAGRAQPQIVAMSASALDGERQSCLDAGMDRHLAKPFRRLELEQLLREVAETRASLSRAGDRQT